MMLLPAGTLPSTHHQEEFSLAYLYAIVAAAGYAFNVPHRDVNSIDVTITQKDTKTFRPEIGCLNVQLKCTYSETPGTDGFLRFDLPSPRIHDY